VPKIEVAFNLDHTGILNVVVRDEGTGKKRIIKLESSGGLSNVDAAADGVGDLAIWEPFDEPKDCDEG
jgi:molecular chaperone DnaK (HSP70)